MHSLILRVAGVSGVTAAITARAVSITPSREAPIFVNHGSEKNITFTTRKTSRTRWSKTTTRHNHTISLCVVTSSKMHQRKVNLRKGLSKNCRSSVALSFAPSLASVFCESVGTIGIGFWSTTGETPIRGFACFSNHPCIARNSKKHQYKACISRMNGNA
jgi:hypothetical protein